MATRDLMERILGRIQDDLGDLKRRVGALEVRMGGVEGRLTGVEGRLTGVEGRLTGVEGRLERLEVAVSEGFLGIHEELQQVIGLLKHQSGQHRAARHRLDDHEKRIVALEEG